MEQTNAVVFDISDFLTDPSKEAEGVWFPLGKKREIKLARAKNDDYKRQIRAKYKANRAILEQEDDAAADLNDQIMIEIYAQTIVKGLRVDGVEVPYTPTDGVKMLQNPDFRDKVFAYANTADSYKTKAEDAAVKS